MSFQVCNSNQDIFPGALCFEFPQNRAVTPTPYKDGTYLVNLTGPGASTVTNKELSEHLKTKKQLKFPFSIFQSDSNITRLFLASPDIPSLHNLQTTFKTKDGKQVKIQLCHPNKQSITFCVDWVPLTVPTECVKELVSSFCVVERLSQDDNPTRYYVTTSSPQKQIPYWMHTSNLVASDDTYRSFKVSIKNRQQMCLYCSSFEHPWHKCPLKKQVKKDRKLLHEKRMSPPEKVPTKKPTPNLPADVEFRPRPKKSKLPNLKKKKYLGIKEK